MADITEKQMKIIEKLITDEQFRRSFFEDADAAIANAGIEISEEEMAAFRQVSQAVFDSVMSEVDFRFSKTGVSSLDAGSVTGFAQSFADKVII